MMLGGRVAEEIFFDTITTGAGDDLRRVTQLAYVVFVTHTITRSISQWRCGDGFLELVT